MIIWRFLIVFKLIKSTTIARSNRIRMLITLVVAAIQAYGFSSEKAYVWLPELGDKSILILRFVTMIILISGAFVLVWLANMNMQYGVGGSSLIIITNMLITFWTNLQSYLLSSQLSLSDTLWHLLILIIVISCLVALSVVVYLAEYRIPMRRIGIISNYAEKTYLPLRLTPAGAMPFMYAMTLMILPPIIINTLIDLLPNNQLLLSVSSQLTLSKLPGILTYMLMLFILSLGFAFFNNDPIDLSDNMRKNGDYIEHVRPGQATKSYISAYLWQLSLLGAIYTVIIGGLPLLIVWSRDGEMGLPLLITNIYIVTTLMMGINEQILVHRSWKSYKELI